MYISRALLRDPGYMKGLAFMQKIYNEENRLKEQTKSLFKDWYVNNLIKNAVYFVHITTQVGRYILKTFVSNIRYI